MQIVSLPQMTCRLTGYSPYAHSSDIVIRAMMSSCSFLLSALLKASAQLPLGHFLALLLLYIVQRISACVRWS